MTDMETSTAPGTAGLSLRERKKQKTRQSIRREAYRLFAEQGYEATTIDQIVAAAEVSHSTFFRYFPAKEDVVLTDEYDPMLAQSLSARPADEPIVDAIRHSLIDSLAAVLVADREELLFKTRLIFNVPAVRARAMDEQLRNQNAIAELICERSGREPGDLEVDCAAAAIIAISMTVIRHWVEGDGKEDLAALYDHHLDLLSRGLRF
ncbi:TetR family transcriptional regulator [Streptomyces sp. SPB162]|uniref:acyl-CoA-like ligand-binding transcription factor n=1 Tax=Streptomyces sp. SPB162 TaxID=2940560 RepID=UPI002404E095|nr:TetR family transcriptional regulator [Streptomyces sp. SPB162]MDF9814944.1 AcrR family transcriptional regulator [Streptomyces sp. SPB162]